MRTKYYRLFYIPRQSSGETGGLRQRPGSVSSDAPLRLASDARTNYFRREPNAESIDSLARDFGVPPGCDVLVLPVYSDEPY